MSHEIMGALYPLCFEQQDEKTYLDSEHEEIEILELLLFYDLYVDRVSRGYRYGLLEQGRQTFVVVSLPYEEVELSFLLPFFSKGIMWC